VKGAVEVYFETDPLDHRQPGISVVDAVTAAIRDADLAVAVTRYISIGELSAPDRQELRRRCPASMACSFDGVVVNLWGELGQDLGLIEDHLVRWRRIAWRRPFDPFAARQ
jgi:hypothetical protein